MENGVVRLRRLSVCLPVGNNSLQASHALLLGRLKHQRVLHKGRVNTAIRDSHDSCHLQCFEICLAGNFSPFETSGTQAEAQEVSSAKLVDKEDVLALCQCTGLCGLGEMGDMSEKALFDVLPQELVFREPVGSVREACLMASMLISIDPVHTAEMD